MGKVWFVTGAGSGIGRALVCRLREKGVYVAATTRHLTGSGMDESVDFLPIETDLSTDEAVSGAVEAVLRKFGTIDVVVNNAGYSLNGAIEEISDEEMMRLFNVNVFTPVRVVRHTAPVFREKGSGTYVSISSMGAATASPIVGMYCAAKAALTAVTEAVGRELGECGVKAISIMPGQVRTDFMGPNMKYAVKGIDAYAGLREQRMTAIRSSHGHQAGSPEKLAEAILELSEAVDPPAHFVAGRQALNHVKEALARVSAEMERYQDLSLATDY